jgi:hypothetical protein
VTGTLDELRQVIEDENDLIDLVEREPSRDELREVGLRCAIFLRGEYVAQLRVDAAAGNVDEPAVAAFHAWRARMREELVALYEDESPSVLLRRAADCGITPESLRGVPAESLAAAVVDRALAVALAARGPRSR